MALLPCGDRKRLARRHLLVHAPAIGGDHLRRRALALVVADAFLDPGGVVGVRAGWRDDRGRAQSDENGCERRDRLHGYPPGAARSRMPPLTRAPGRSSITYGCVYIDIARIAGGSIAGFRYSYRQTRAKQGDCRVN